jgi:CHAD domain-containing protein
MSRKATVDRSIRDALRPRLHRLIVNLWNEEDAARNFTDPEGVHRMRVVSRKLRAALDASGDVGTKEERRLCKQVRQLARALGAVRDGDVMIEDLRRFLDDGADHPGITRLVDRLDRQRAKDREQLLELLDELEAGGFRAWSLTVFAKGKNDAARKIRRRDARDLVGPPRDLFIAMTSALPVEGDIEALHRLRIVTKRLRYVVQLMERPLKPVATEILSPLGAMQDQLGDIHNDDVLIALVRDELHALVDQSIATAMSGEDIDRSGTIPAWNDLLDLLATTTRERHARYVTFVRWWSDLQDSGFPAQLTALGAAKP